MFKEYQYYSNPHNQHVLYISRRKLDFRKKQQLRNAIANIQYAFDETEKKLIITNLEVATQYRNMRYGSYLMFKAVDHARKVGMETIILDDMISGSSYKNSDKLGFYRKCGLSYINEGEPEMEGSINQCYLICKFQSKMKRKDIIA